MENQTLDYMKTDQFDDHHSQTPPPPPPPPPSATTSRRLRTASACDYMGGYFVAGSIYGAAWTTYGTYHQRAPPSAKFISVVRHGYYRGGEWAAFAGIALAVRSAAVRLRGKDDVFNTFAAFTTASAAVSAVAGFSGWKLAGFSVAWGCVVTLFNTPMSIITAN